MYKKTIEKLTILKTQKNNYIKLLAVTIALSSVTAMDNAQELLDDSLGGTKVSKSVVMDENGGDKKALSITSISQEQTVQSPTVANVLRGWAQFIGETSFSVLSYLTPNFVKSSYSNISDFFGNIGDFFSRISTKKKSQ